jgi:hypothetical protein
LLLGLVPFRLVVSPLQPGVVGSYLVRGIIFSNRVLPEGTGPYPDLLGHNRQITVPKVQDPDKNLILVFYKLNIC